MNQGFEIETMFNDGQRVKILKNGKNTTVISSDWVDVTTVLDYVNSFDWAYYTPMGIFFGDELETVESFECFAARTQTTEEPEAIVYTEQQKQELIWDAENAAHQQHIDEQNTFHL